MPDTFPYGSSGVGNIVGRRITNLPAAGAISGSEIIPGVQEGATVKMTAAQFIQAALLAMTAQRTVTAAGPVTVAVDDFQVLLNKTVGEATTVTLPNAATVVAQGYNYGPKTIKDLKGDAQTNNITIVVDGGGTIDGQASLGIFGNYGSAQLWPLENGTGYYVSW